MATEKIFNSVRFGHKVDTLENWNSSTLALKRGEIAFAIVEPTEENGLPETILMAKIGEDGVKTFKDLTWNFHAKASDVVAAAKDEAALEEFISDVINNSGIATSDALQTLSEQVTQNKDDIATLNGDASTEGSVAKAIADAILALDLANTYDAKGAAAQALADAKEYADGKDTAIAEAKQAGTDAQSAVDTLAGKVGEVAEGKTVVEMIADAQAAATYDDTQVKADIKANADAIDAIEADYLKAADKEALQTQINTIMNNPDAEGAINSINEFTQYVEEHGTVAEGFRADIDKNKEDIGANAAAVAAEATRATGVEEALAGRLDALEAIDSDAYIEADETVLSDANSYTDQKDTAMGERVDAVSGVANTAVQTATAGTGLKVSKTGTDVSIDFDDEVVMVFDCGTSAQ